MSDKFANTRIYKDEKLTGISTQYKHILPYILSSSPPPNLINGTGGGIAYDILSKKVYYNDGSQWLPINNSTAPGTSEGYSHVKSGDQSIVTSTDIILAPWTIIPSPPYHTISGWNLVSGIYTAGVSQTLEVNVGVSWASGISNLGNRIARVLFFDSSAATTIVAKESRTQADPNTNVETTQELSTSLKMDPGDQAWIEVRHNAPINLTISGGSNTTVCGCRILL